MQVLLPGQLHNVLVQSLHATAGKHQAFPQGCKKFYKKITFLQLQHTSEAGLVSVKYAFNMDKTITHDSLHK